MIVSAVVSERTYPLTEQEKPKPVRMLLQGRRPVRGLGPMRTRITDVETGRNVPWLLDSGIHIEGKAGSIARMTLTVLPHLDIWVEATLRYICPTCKRPLGQEPVQKQVRISSEGEIAISTRLAFTDVETDLPLVDVAAYSIDYDNNDGAERLTAVLDCVPLDAIKKYKKSFTPDGACHFCKRTLTEPHHEDCSCEVCSLRRYREEEQRQQEDDAFWKEWHDMTAEERIAAAEA